MPKMPGLSKETMIPNKPLDLLIDQVIENEIDTWVEMKLREPEQLDFDDSDN